MNQRILELAKESGYVYHVGGTVPYFEFSNNQLEKFAQLIVQECMKVCDQSLSKHELPSDKIAEHFGVE